MDQAGLLRSIIDKHGQQWPEAALQRLLTLAAKPEKTPNEGIEYTLLLDWSRKAIKKGVLFMEDAAVGADGGEQFYDAVIAPQLLAMAKVCEGKGLSFLAFCEYDPPSYGHTAQFQKGTSFAMRLIDAAAKAEGNIDRLYFSLYRWAKENGKIGESLVLATLGRMGDETR